MSFTKTTVRALAASVVIVAAGGTVASAAVLHLPILGFGRERATAITTAATVVTPVRTRTARVAHKVHPRVVVRTRYVNDIVHRPAPVSAQVSSGYAMPAATAPAMVSPPPVAPVAPTTAAPVTVPPAVAAPTTTPRYGESETDDAHEHEGAGGHEDDDAAAPTTVSVGSTGSTTTTTTTPAAGR